MTNEVDLSSFELKKGLTGRIWEKGGVIKSRVRLELLDIADDFWNDLGLDWVEVKDIILTGSICNYNWSEFSDIDLHIVVDYSQVDENTELVEKFFKGKKQEWCDAHDIQIKGFDVEVYVQDSNAENESGGVYSLERNEWVKKPSKSSMERFEDDGNEISDLCDEVIMRVGEMKRGLRSITDRHQIGVIHDTAEMMVDRLVGIRKESLKKDGEMGKGNILYKALRRNNVIDDLYDIIDASYDAIHSID